MRHITQLRVVPMTSTFPAAQSYRPIRPVNIGRDMPRVMMLLNRVFSPTLDAEGRRALNSLGNQPSLILRINQFGSKVCPGFVCEHNGSIIGNVSIIPTRVKGRVIIANVAVDVNHRRQGIARELMETTLDHLARRGMHSVLLQVDTENNSAYRLYQTLSFRDMGSTTWWMAAPGSLREIASDHRFEIRPLRASAHREAFDLDRASYPIDLNWPDPIDSGTYRSGFFRGIDNFLNGRSAETWVVEDEDRKLLGMGSIWSEWGRPHRLTLRTRPEHHDALTRPLLAKLLRRLTYIRRRHTSIEHLSNDNLTSQLLVAANFHPRRHLTTMRRVL